MPSRKVTFGGLWRYENVTKLLQYTGPLDYYLKYPVLAWESEGEIWAVECRFGLNHVDRAAAPNPDLGRKLEDQVHNQICLTAIRPQCLYVTWSELS